MCISVVAGYHCLYILFLFPDVLKTDLEKSQEEKSQLETELKKLQSKYQSELLQNLSNQDNLRLELDKTKAEFVQTLVAYEQTKIELEDTKAEAEKARSEFQQTINQYEENNTHLLQYQSYYKENHEQHQQTSQELDQARADLNKCRTELTMTFQKMHKQKQIDDKHDLDIRKLEDGNIKLKKNNDKYLTELNRTVVAKNQLEAQFSALSLQYQNKEQELNNASLNMSNVEASYHAQSKKNEELQEELNQLKDTTYNYSSIIKARNASISQMKLSEERLTLETSKLRKDLKEFKDSIQSCMESVEGYASIKLTLEEVFQGDAKFCHTMMSEEKFSDLTESEICQMVKFMLKDYIVEREAHMGELEQCMKKMNQHKADSFKYNKSLVELTAKYNAQIPTLNRKEEELKHMSQMIDTIAKENSNKLHLAVKEKNEQIAKLEKEANNQFKLASKLQGEILKFKSDVRTKEIVNELKSREKQFVSKISSLKEQTHYQENLILTLEKTNYILESSNKKKVNPAEKNSMIKKLEDEVEELKAELTGKEYEFNQKVQNYMQDLEKMKTQVGTLKYS